MNLPICTSRTRTTFTALAACLALSATVGAQVVEGDAAGEDNLADPRYYGIDFVSSGPAGDFIASASFDISADIDGIFDLDGSGNFNGALEPVVQLSSLVGLNAADITWSFTGANPNVITANFAPGSFGVGDSFRFACETDLFVSDPCPGGNFVTGGAVFSATLEGGPTASATFDPINSEVGVATVDFSNCTLSLSIPDRTVQVGGSVTVDIDLDHNAPWTAYTRVNAIVKDANGKVVTAWTSSRQTMPPGTSLSVHQDLQLPPWAKPGVYTVGVGIGSMRPALTLRWMEFEIERPDPTAKTGPSTAAVK